MSTNTERGPLWPFMLVAQERGGTLEWRYREYGEVVMVGEWRDSRAAALADLYEHPDLPAHVGRAALEEYSKIAATAFRTATSTLRGPGWDL